MQTYLRWKGGRARAFTLSHDDGVVQDGRLVDVLNKHGLKATFNLNAGQYLPEDAVREKYRGRMKRSEALALYKGSGHEVATHGYSHPFLDRISAPDCVREIMLDRMSLEADYGTLVCGHAYPYGAYNANVKRILGDCGIAYARTTVQTNGFDIPNDFLEWHSTCHHASRQLPELVRRFFDRTAIMRQHGLLFYVWGHSYEFDDADNWSVIEELAEKVGGHEDVWYATNGEICDYVNAYRRLEKSADGKTVYNPSATELFLAVKGEVYRVGAGETVHI